MDPVVRWVRGWPGWVTDAILAALLLAFVVPLTAVKTVHGYRTPDALAVVLAAVACVGAIERQRRPELFFGIALAPMLVFVGRHFPGGWALLPLLIAVYTIAVKRSRKRSLALAVFAGLSLGLASQLFTTEALGTAVSSASAWLGAALFLGWAVANRRAFVAEIQDRAERAERTREEEARRRVDAERLRIARELHDVVAHGISTINVQAGVAAHVSDREPEQATRALVAIKQTSKEALRELRSLLDVLRQPDDKDPSSPSPGLAQLDALVSTTSQAGVLTEVRVDGNRRPLPATVDLSAYRIVQESLTNVLRHAGNASACVRISYEDRRVVVSVSDNGRGADGSTFQEGARHGIAGMRERAAAVGGSLEAGPGPLGGFQIIATLPTEEASAR